MIFFLSTLKRSLQEIHPPLIWSSTWATTSSVPCNPVFVGPNTLVLAHSRDGSVGNGCYSLELWTSPLSLALKDEGWSKGSSQPPGSNGAFWNLQQLAQFPFLPWSRSELPCWQAAACEMHISKQMAPGAHNCCQTCVDFNSPFSLALCEITCLCVVTQLNCQLWWLSLAFTTISGNHQYYLRGWTEEEKIIPEVQVNILVSVNEAAFFSGLKETWAELSFPIFILGLVTSLITVFPVIKEFLVPFPFSRDAHPS